MDVYLLTAIFSNHHQQLRLVMKKVFKQDHQKHQDEAILSQIHELLNDLLSANTLSNRTKGEVLKYYVIGRYQSGK